MWNFFFFSISPLLLLRLIASTASTEPKKKCNQRVDVGDNENCKFGDFFSKLCRIVEKGSIKVPTRMTEFICWGFFQLSLSRDSFASSARDVSWCMDLTWQFHFEDLKFSVVILRTFKKQQLSFASINIPDPLLFFHSPTDALWVLIYFSCLRPRKLSWFWRSLI